jgi:hypothetical protein
MESQDTSFVSPQSRGDSQCRNQPAASGRHVRCGRPHGAPRSRIRCSAMNHKRFLRLKNSFADYGDPNARNCG